MRKLIYKIKRFEDTKKFTFQLFDIDREILYHTLNMSSNKEKYNKT